jgi:hypothetical protein
MSSTGDPTQLRQDIEATREELGETVEALAAKTDVTGQAKRKFEETRAQVAGKAENIAGRVREATPESAAVAAGQAAQGARRKPALIALALLIVGILIGRRTA